MVHLHYILQGFSAQRLSAATLWIPAIPATVQRRGASYVYVLFFVNLTGYALGVGGTASLAQHAFLEDWAPVGGLKKKRGWLVENGGWFAHCSSISGDTWDDFDRFSVNWEILNILITIIDILWWLINHDSNDLTNIFYYAQPYWAWWSQWTMGQKPPRSYQENIATLTTLFGWHEHQKHQLQGQTYRKFRFIHNNRDIPSGKLT